jgi:hypothetical protein
MKTKPQGENLLDFRAAVQVAEQPVTFSASTGTHQASYIPASIRELGLQLGLAPEGRMFSFNQVMRLILHRGIVLTDNRRLPLRRRFPISALSGSVNLNADHLACVLDILDDQHRQPREHSPRKLRHVNHD